MNNMPFYGDDLIELSENAKTFSFQSIGKKTINVLRRLYK